MQKHKQSGKRREHRRYVPRRVFFQQVLERKAAYFGKKFESKLEHDI